VARAAEAAAEEAAAAAQAAADGAAESEPSKRKRRRKLPPTHSVGCGLVNLNNTCYANAVLQCLTHILPLREKLLAREHSRD
jgi:ubiquitin C-terminal hydrolase